MQAADSGVASATVNTMQQVGGSVGTALLNTIAATAAAGYADARTWLPSQPQLLRAHAAVHSYTTRSGGPPAIFAVGALIGAIVLRPGVPEIDPERAGGVVL